MTRFRGYEIEYRDGEFVFSDTGEPTASTWESRPCGFCGKFNTPEGHDGCLGTLPGVMNACCGHGVEGEAYIQFQNGDTLHGSMALVMFGKAHRGGLIRFITQRRNVMASGVQREIEVLECHCQGAKDTTCTKCYVLAEIAKRDRALDASEADNVWLREALATLFGLIDAAKLTPYDKKTGKEILPIVQKCRLALKGTATAGPEERQNEMQWISLSGLTEWPDGTPKRILAGYRSSGGMWCWDDWNRESPESLLAMAYTHYAIITGPQEQDNSEWNAAVEKCAETAEEDTARCGEGGGCHWHISKAIRALKRPE